MRAYIVATALIVAPSVAWAQEAALPNPDGPAAADPAPSAEPATGAATADQPASGDAEKPAGEDVETPVVVDLEALQPETLGLLCVSPMTLSDEARAAAAQAAAVRAAAAIGNAAPASEPGPDESETALQVQLDYNERQDAASGVRIPLSSRSRHRLRVYDGQTLVQSFQVDLRKYARANLRLQKKEGHDTWVLRQMRSPRCPYPEMTFGQAPTTP